MQLPTKLFNKNFFLLWQGQLISQLGNQAFSIGLMFWIKHVTDSASLVALIMIVSALPTIILGPLAGAFADRYSRKAIIIITDSLSGLFLVFLAIIMLVFPSQTELLLILLFVVSTIMSILATFFRPTISAAIPDIVPSEKTTSANSFHQFSIQFATILGQGTGGVLFRFFGAPLLFLFAGISFMVASFGEVFIKIPQKITSNNQTRKFKEIWADLKNDVIESFHYIKQNKGLKVLYFVWMGINFLFTPLIVLLAFYVEDFLKLTTDWYGYFMAIFGIGAILGYIIIGIVKLIPKTRMYVMVFVVFGHAIILILLGFIHSIIIAMFLSMFLGLLNGMVNILNVTQLQLTTPSDMRGRIFGLLNTIATAIIPISMAMAGIAADISGKNVTLIFAICGFFTFLLAIFAATNKYFRGYLESDSVELDHGSSQNVEV
jgi:DHA3 family macrolide efflux protein-like MFS transporter